LRPIWSIPPISTKRLRRPRRRRVWPSVWPAPRRRSWPSVILTTWSWRLTPWWPWDAACWKNPIRFLKLLSGRNHRVFTGVAVICGGRTSWRVVDTRVSFKPLSQDEIAAYVASGEWRGKAGGYGIQGRAAAFITRIVGSHPAVMGLPLYEAANLLRGAGWRGEAA